ncbi:MAG: HDIG domain-containing protein [Leptolyngbyaceae cyanobacterium bins.302]|nr:HDIG domain-containing protein [Leptolyngbyaceae cyanobacterium bins.302]
MVLVMKLFRSLVRQIEEARSQHTVRRLNQYVETFRKAIQASKPFPNTKQAIASPEQKSPKNLLHQASHSPWVLALTVISLTSALGYRFYNAPKLDVGREATQTIHAPATATVEDPKATEENRKLARTGSLPVLQLDQEATQQIQRRLQQQLQQGSDIRGLAGTFPYVKTAFLSIPVQATLRKMPEAQWQSVLRSIDPNTNQGNAFAAENHAVDSPSNTPVSETQQKQAIAELRAHRRSVDLGAFLLLIREISDARSRYVAAIATLSNPISPKLPEAFDLAVLDLTDTEWIQLRKAVPQIADRILTQGISPGLPNSVLQSAIELHLEGGVIPGAQDLSNQLLAALLEPNLIRDEEQTRLRAEKAAQEIPPVMVSIRRNELIVRQGDIITSREFALLEHFKLSRREIDWWGLVGFGVLVSGAVALVWVVKQRYTPALRRRDAVLLWLLSLSTPLLIALQVPSTNLPVVGLLTSSFYGAPLGLTVTGLLSVLLAVGMDMNVSYLISSAAGGILCGWLGARLRSREELALLGVGVGLLQGTLYLVLNVASGTVWYTLLGVSVFQGIIGLAWVIIGMGSSPYLEQLFDLVTTIRLVELANPNRALLKKLAAQAPGTFQHTLFVASLAEAAGRALGCNVELVRTGTLYHDIGKMHDPLGFIENQMGGPNKHDVIDDPWVSAEIIKKHVSEGLVMARKARLPKAVQAFIPEHQGTMLIAYFHHQAQQRTTTLELLTPMKESDFRYDGPIPQSRETGIVMLADSCEAALRSLKDAAPEEALNMINKILRARWQDNQLVESGLTRAEMTQIAEIFVQVWQQFNHQRIAYPKLSPVPQIGIK